MNTSYDVQFWDIQKRARRRPYEVRWKVAGRTRPRSFVTKALASSFRSALMTAARKGEPFDVDSGLPERDARAAQVTTWYEHAKAYAEMKWPGLAATSRRALADALAAVTAELVTPAKNSPSPAELRSALYGWAFNPSASRKEPPAELADVVAWFKGSSVPVTALAEPAIVWRTLNACARTLTGVATAATTVQRKRAVLYNALGYAVELGHLSANPIDRVQWRAPETASTVDRRVVVSPVQARELLTAVSYASERGERLVAFFACVYYAGMRPGEVLMLREADCVLPETGWGRLNLNTSAPRAGHDWTDSDDARDERGLKHRGENETRSVPIPPELVAHLCTHIERFGVAEDGRLFRSARGGTVQDSVYAATWRKARLFGLTPAQQASPLARRTYDLRHAAASLWLNAGVAPTEVARRLGHGVAVSLKVYVNCIDGQESVANERIAAALGTAQNSRAGRGRLATGSASVGLAASHSRANEAVAEWVGGCSCSSGGLA